MPHITLTLLASSAFSLYRELERLVAGRTDATIWVSISAIGKTRTTALPRITGSSTKAADTLNCLE